jgi:hypothetical protein
MFRILGVIVIIIFFENCNSCFRGNIMEENNQKRSSERILFDQGSEPGKLFYPANDYSPVLPFPERVAIGPDGEISILEPALNRIQGFNSNGNFLSVLTNDIICESIQRNKRSISADIINVFSKGRFIACTLVAIKIDKDSVNQYWLVTYQIDSAKIIECRRLSGFPGDIDFINISFLDENGYLWLFTKEWLTFTPDGQFITTLGRNGNFVDPDGFLYLVGDSIKLKDHNGKTRITLFSEMDKEVEINGGDSKSLLFSWDRNSEEVQKTPFVTYQNKVNIFQVDFTLKSLLMKRSIELKETILSNNNQNPDVSEPIEVYLRELAVLQGEYFYIFGYSNNKYWIDKYNIKGWISP